MGEKSRPHFPTPIKWCKQCGYVKCQCKKKLKKPVDIKDKKK